jgi:hypothetical protein
MGTAALSLALGCVVRAEVIPEIETAKGLARAIMIMQFPELEGRKGLRPDLLRSYDLDQARGQAVKRLTSEPEFSAFLSRKESALPPDQIRAIDIRTKARWLAEFVQSRDDVEPEVKAWIYLWAFPHIPWDQALAAYYRLEKFRLNDFVPAVMLAAKLSVPTLDPPNREQWLDLIAIERRALPHATNTEDWIDCVNAVGLAAKDFQAAAEIAPRCRMRIFLPMYLVFGGKKEEGYARFEKLRQDPTLSDSERAGLWKLEPMILMFSDHFEQARRVINEGRATPTLAGQEWLDRMEQLLDAYQARDPKQHE